MNRDLFPLQNLGAKFIPQFIHSGIPMATGRNQNGDVGLGVTLADFCQHLRHDHLGGNRAGVVAGDDDYFILALGHDAELGGSDGVFQSLPHQLLLRGGRFVVVHVGDKLPQKALFGEIVLNIPFTIGKSYNWHGYPPSSYEKQNYSFSPISMA